MSEVLYRYSYAEEVMSGIGIIIEVPIDTYIRYAKDFTLLWTQYTTTFTSMVQLLENEYFLSELSDIGGPAMEALQFFLYCGCLAIKIKVTEPLLFYE